MKKVYDWVKKIYAVNELQGYSDEEINYMKQLFGEIPEVVEEFYRVAAKTDELHHVQDFWTDPEYYKKYNWLKKMEYLILLNENQSVCQAGICREDLQQPDPPVYVTMDGKEWKRCANTTSEFLAIMLGYEAIFTFAYNPEEFFWMNEEEVKIIQRELVKLPYEMSNWISDIQMTLYCNAEDNLVVVMDCGDEWQVLYGAASKDSYDKLMEVMRGLGEEM